MSEDDEGRFLEFLRCDAEVRLFEAFAKSADTLVVDCFAPRVSGHYTYRLWNTAFRWEPAFKQAQTGEWYVSNSGAAPVIEYTRYRFAAEDSVSYGRLYWAKTFAAPEGVGYDLDSFDRWFSKVASWVRTHGKKKLNEPHGMYFLPGALAL